MLATLRLWRRKQAAKWLIASIAHSAGSQLTSQ